MGTETTLRDYFAAHCPASEIGECNWAIIKAWKGLPPAASIDKWRDGWAQEWRCEQRYKYADTMLKARGATD